MMKRLTLKIFHVAIVAVLLLPAVSLGDITVVREVVITPKSVNAAANIGSVNSSPNIRMESAQVNISVGVPDETYQSKGFLRPVPLKVKALFSLVNQSAEELKLTIGFPVSNSEYSSYELSSFRVMTDDFSREVFRRKSGYPRRLVHEYISGELGPDKSKPPSDIDIKKMTLFGEQLMGEGTFQNLMVWEESFLPGQKRQVEVHYEILIPLQVTSVVRKQEKGNHKGIWPQEANNIPVNFLKKLDSGPYYFFDYYLTSGASWAGSIAFEDITLNFDPWWQDLDFYSTVRSDQLSWSNTTLYPGIPIVAYYQLRDVEPTKNIYFAVRPGPDNETMQKERNRRMPDRAWLPVEVVPPR